MRTKVILVLLFAFLLFFLGAFCVYYASEIAEAAPAQDGRVALKDPLNNRVFDLSGEWDFFPGLLVGPADFTAAKTPGRIPVPASWRSASDGLFSTQPEIGTYRLQISGLRGLKSASLRLPPVRSAGRIWINGREYALSSTLADTVQQEIPSAFSETLTVPVPSSGVWDVVLQVSNFHHVAGGIWESRVLVGDPDAVGLRNSLLSAVTIFIVSSLLVSFLLFVTIASLSFLAEHLFFGLFILAAIVRTLATEQKVLVQLSSQLSWQLVHGLEYISLFAGGVMLAFFVWSRYAEALRRSPLVAYTLLSAVLAVVYFLIPAAAAGYLILTHLVLSSVLIVYAGGVFFSLFRQGNIGAGLHLLGGGLLIALGINDCLLFIGIIHSVYLLPLGFMFFVFLHLLAIILNVQDDYATIRDLHEHMRSADRLKDHFLENTSHELRTPIHGIVGLSESLLRGALGELNEDQRSTLSLVFSSGLRLNAMVSDILDFSRIREGSIRLQPAEVDLYQVISIVGRMCTPLLLGKPLKLENAVEPHGVFVMGDENRIEQVFYNLIGAAINFTEEGTISITAREESGQVAIEVTVTGMGLSSEKVNNIFSAYETDNLSLIEGFEGSGIGLAITRKLIELHGGKISYRIDGDGTAVFSFSLPPGRGELSDQESDELELSLDALENLESLNEDEDDESLESSEKSRLTLMVIDDNPVNLQVMKNQLSGDEYRVVPFLSGEAALEHFDENPPDLVLLDIMMTRMNGYEVCRRIREKHTATDLPVILVTAKSEVMDMEEGLKAGANDFLAKPYTQEELLARVRTHLNLSRINTIYSRFVPMEFLNFLGHDNIVDIQLGDQVQKEMTVLFVDIRAFTALSESMTPQENFKFINSFLSRLSPMIQDNGGIIDKYIGDSIMALFPNRPEDAIKAAVEMVDHMELYNKQRATCGYRPISIGVGIHTGNLILGIIGDEGRMQGTVISDAVNLASRIQDVTKLYGANIIISQESFIKLENPTDYGFRFLGKVRVKGKNRSVSLFEIFDGDHETQRNLKNDTKTDFESAILLFSKREFDNSADLFKRIIAANPDDRAARLFLEKAETFIAQEKRRFLFSG